MVEILDRLHASNTQAQERGHLGDLSFLNQQTIKICGNCINGDQKEEIHELVDEQLKTKIAARLLREYRRVLENQKEKMKTQLIEANNETARQIEKSKQSR